MDRTPVSVQYDRIDSTLSLSRLPAGCALSTPMGESGFSLKLERHFEVAVPVAATG